MTSDKIQKSYTAFAPYYDELMAHVPYFEWSSFILKHLSALGISYEANILELACGTGSLMHYLHECFQTYIGSDISPAMLHQAKLKGFFNIFCSDMVCTPFVKERFQAIISTHDSVNYLKSESKLREFIKESARILRPKGVLLFDVSSEKNIKKNFDKKRIKQKLANTQIDWYNKYNNKKKILYSEISFSPLKNNKKALLVESVHESHEQCFFSVNTIINMLQKNGFTKIEQYADYQDFKKNSKADLIVFIAVKS